MTCTISDLAIFDCFGDLNINAGTDISLYGKGDLSVCGDFYLNGNFNISDPLRKLNYTVDTVDTDDIGFYGLYDDIGTTSAAGLFRDATNKKFRFFQNLTVDPTNNIVDIGHTSYNSADVIMDNLELISSGITYNADLDFIAGGSSKVTITTVGDVGIGTESPNGHFHLVDNNNQPKAPLKIEQTGNGDSSINFEAGGTNWAVGIDNDDSDNFKISKS